MVLFGAAINLNAQDCTNCDNTTTGIDTYSSAIGQNTSAMGFGSFASGYEVHSLGNFAFGHGKFINAKGGYSMVLGQYAETSAPSLSAMIIGAGGGSDYILENTISNSLMIGFNSSKHTFFVKGALGEGYTGKIGIGDITDPHAKLHIKADDGENVGLLLEPGSSGNFAKIKFGEIDDNDSPNRIEAKQDGDLDFYTASDYVFRDGDVFIEDINSGIIMKSPDGQCWRGKMDNSGSLVFEAVDCDLLTKTDENKTIIQQQINIFPNPANEVITILVTENDKPLIVQILNMKSELVLSRTMQSEKIKIKTKKLLAGNYIIKISEETGKVVLTEKIVVL